MLIFKNNLSTTQFIIYFINKHNFISLLILHGIISTMTSFSCIICCTAFNISRNLQSFRIFHFVFYFIMFYYVFDYFLFSFAQISRVSDGILDRCCVKNKFLIKITVLFFVNHFSFYVYFLSLYVVNCP